MHCYLGQQAALCGVSSQPITWRLCVNHPVSLSASTNKTEAWTWGAVQLWHSRLGNCWHFETGSLKKKEKKKKNRTCDLCASEKCPPTPPPLWLYSKHWGNVNTLKNGVGKKKKVLLKSMPVDPGRNLLVSLKRKNYKMLPFDKKNGPVIETLECLKAFCTPCMLLGRVASPVHCVVVLAFYAAIQSRRQPCALTPTWPLKHLFTFRNRLALQTDLFTAPVSTLVTVESEFSKTVKIVALPLF